MTRRAFWCTVLALFLVPAGFAVSAQRVPLPEGARSWKTVTVTSVAPASSPRTFAIVIQAETPATRIKGLQGFRALLPGEAALFDFDPPQQVSFWMASLSYAIDIIYVDASGVVTEVFPDCQPESQEIFSSRRPVRWVIETSAGSGIRSGDRVRME